jgi:hypothetical protein
MATKNGVGVSKTPFEQRYRPPDPRRRRREVLTWGDRLVCAICGGVLGLVLWTFAYLILIAIVLKAVVSDPIPAAGPVAAAPAGADVAPAVPVDPWTRLPAFSWGGTVAVAFALFGAVVGAERMLDGFEKVVRVEDEVARAVNES